MSPLDHERMNDDRFDDRLHSSLLDDELDSDSDELAYDADDAADLALMREALGSYKTETLRFAEQQSAAMPVPRVSKAAALWAGTPRWAIAATAVLAVGFTTVVATHRSSTPEPIAMASAPTAQALHDDNNLLLSVDQALNTSVAPTEEELGLTTGSAHLLRHGRATDN